MSEGDECPVCGDGELYDTVDGDLKCPECKWHTEGTGVEHYPEDD